MLMKNRNAIPKILLEALEKDISALKIFMNMSETYQKLYIMQVTDPNFGDSMRERVERTIQDIHKHGAENSANKWAN